MNTSEIGYKFPCDFCMEVNAGKCLKKINSKGNKGGQCPANSLKSFFQIIPEELHLPATEALLAQEGLERIN